MLGDFLARTERDTWRSCWTTIQPHKLINREQSELSLSPFLMLQVNQGLHKWPPDKDIVKGLQLMGIAICRGCRPQPCGS